MRTLFSVLSLMLTLQFVQGQSYSFDPGSDYQGILAMDQYTVHQVNVYHDLSDSAYIYWRLVGNTCPSGWDFQMCDWGHCYSGMPNHGNMLAVAQGNYGFIELLVNPYNIPGEGDVQFWIFPTGNMDAHVELTFHFSTEITSIVENASDFQVKNISNSSLSWKSSSAGEVRIYNVSGQLVHRHRATVGLQWLSLETLEPGYYVCVMPDLAPFHFYKK